MRAGGSASRPLPQSHPPLHHPGMRGRRRSHEKAEERSQEDAEGRLRVGLHTAAPDTHPAMCRERARGPQPVHSTHTPRDCGPLEVYARSGV